jgi:exosortase family protein XrtF
MKVALNRGQYTRFLIVAGLLYLVFYLVYQFVVRKYTFYDQKFIGLIIENSDFVLRQLGFKTFKVLLDRDMQVLGVDGASGVWIGSNCNAITLFALFAVFVMAYPGPLKNKLWFVPAGIIVIHAINVFRVVALAIINIKAPQYLDFNHTYTFTFLVYGFIFFLWMLWANRFSNAGKKTTH